MPSDTRTLEQTCTACSAINRIPRVRLLEDPKCGRCGQKLFPRHPATVTDASFASEVERSPIPVLVDFWASWCPPCRAIAPVLDQLAGERAGRLKVAKVNVDENPGLSARFAVRSIPTLLLVKDGRVVDQLAGALPRPELVRWLDSHSRA
jgi:thioredoxin 2